MACQLSAKYSMHVDVINFRFPLTSEGGAGDFEKISCKHTCSKKKLF